MTPGETDREILVGLRAQVKAGFDSINRRLDQLNGSVARHEQTLGDHALRLERLDGVDALATEQVRELRTRLEAHEIANNELENRRPSVIKAVFWIAGLLALFQAISGFAIYEAVMDKLLKGG